MLAMREKICKMLLGSVHRAVAQAGSALRSGRRGRRFESCQLDFEDAGAASPPQPGGTNGMNGERDFNA